MPRTVFTTTISLPKSMAKTLARMRTWENRSTSGLIRAALQHYERSVPRRKMTPAAWRQLNAQLKRVSAAGKKISLADFVARDRWTH